MKPYGNDVFVLLPMGYGKLFIYAILPSVFDDITDYLLLFIHGSYAYTFMLQERVGAWFCASHHLQLL